MRDEGSYYWFSQTLFFQVNLHRPYSEKEKFRFVQDFEATSSVHKIDREFKCVCLRSISDDGLDHFLNFDIDNPITFEASEWYAQTGFSSIPSEHHIV